MVIVLDLSRGLITGAFFCLAFGWFKLKREEDFAFSENELRKLFPGKGFHPHPLRNGLVGALVGGLAGVLISIGPIPAELLGPLEAMIRWLPDELIGGLGGALAGVLVAVIQYFLNRD